MPEGNPEIYEEGKEMSREQKAEKYREAAEIVNKLWKKADQGEAIATEDLDVASQAVDEITPHLCKTYELKLKDSLSGLYRHNHALKLAATTNDTRSEK